MASTSGETAGTYLVDSRLVAEVLKAAGYASDSNEAVSKSLETVLSALRSTEPPIVTESSSQSQDKGDVEPERKKRTTRASTKAAAFEEVPASSEVEVSTDAPPPKTSAESASKDVVVDSSLTSEVVVSTDPVTLAVAALQALANQPMGNSQVTVDVIARLQEALHVENAAANSESFISDLVNDVASEVVVMAQAAQNVSKTAEEMLKSTPSKTKSGMLKIHKCPECDKAFGHTSILAKHIHMHTIEKQCECCDKVFASPAKMAIHIRCHHSGEKQRDSICEVCGKGFYNNSKLRVHMRTHTGERPYKCTYCDMAFTSGSHRKRHERLHTGEHAFVCDVCGKGFGSASNLKDHGYIHTKETPYVCHECDRGFTQWGALQRHINAIHEKRKDEKCTWCGKSFARKDYLKLHVSKCHWIKCDNCKERFETDEEFKTHSSSPCEKRAKRPRSEGGRGTSSAAKRNRTVDPYYSPAKRPTTRAVTRATAAATDPGPLTLKTKAGVKPKTTTTTPPTSRRKKTKPNRSVLLDVFDQVEDDPLRDMGQQTSTVLEALEEGNDEIPLEGGEEGDDGEGGEEEEEVEVVEGGEEEEVQVVEEHIAEIDENVDIIVLSEKGEQSDK